MNLYPIKLAGVCKSAIWGGTRLNKLYGKGNGATDVAESWELTVRPNGVSTVANGEYKGMRLDEVLNVEPAMLGREVCGDFPLLIKFIDAADDLSVQVHPDDKYAKMHESDSGKSEFWYVIDAAHDGEIIYGVCDGIDDAKLCNGLAAGDHASLLRRVAVSAGDAFYIPAGQIHALCHGTLIAEIQQNSDLTYRIFDYDRLGADGRPRELHTKKALDVARAFDDREIEKMRFCGRSGRRAACERVRVLADCEFFRVSELCLENGESVDVFVGDDSFLSLVFISCGDVSLLCTSSAEKASSGDTFFIPAGIGRVSISGRCKVLLAEV